MIEWSASYRQSRANDHASVTSAMPYQYSSIGRYSSILLPGLAGGAGTSATGASTRVEARGDILLALPGGITIADFSITHPLAINTLAAAATTAGVAAARREQQKRATYSRVEPNGYPFVPYSVESYGRIGQPAMKLIHALGDEAAGPGGVTRASLVASALQEIT
jgi:hypothetical protein